MNVLTAFRRGLSEGGLIEGENAEIEFRWARGAYQDLFQFVPYRGGAPMIQDLVAGQIDLTFAQVASSLAQVRAGQIKAYAVMAKTRW